MTCRIGINGFGRIGRMVLRRTLTLPDVEVVAINDLAHIGDLAYLLKYDSVHGLFPGEVSHDDHAILVNGQAMQFSSEKEPAKIPWGRAGRRRGDRIERGVSRPQGRRRTPARRRAQGADQCALGRCGRDACARGE